MATRTNTVDSTDLDAATVTAVASNDALVLDRFDTNFDTHTSKPAVDLASFLADREWTGNFDAYPLNIQCNQASATTIIRFGGDVFRLRSNSGAGTHKDILWDPVKASAILDLQEVIAPKIRGRRGNVFVADSVTPTSLYFGGECKAYLKGTTHLATLIDLSGAAMCDTEKGFTTAKIAGTARLRVNGVACAAGAVELYGGTLELKRASSLGSLTAKSGVIDASQLAADVAASGGTIGGDVTIIMPTGGAEFDYSACTLENGGPKLIRN